MPVHDFECRVCGTQILDHYQPRVGAKPPECPNSIYTPEGHRDPTHRMERLWTHSFSHRPFQPFSAEVDGAVRQFNSLSEVRHYERESTRRGSPSIFRMFSQNPGNMSDNSFGPQKFQPFQTRNSRGQPFIIRKK